MKKILFLLFAFIVFANAETIKLSAGAGYKKPVLEILSLFKDVKVEPFFGNLSQISAQAKQTDMQIVIGDKNYLSEKSGINFTSFHTLGRGRAVIVYGKNVKLDKYEDLKSEKIQKIALPQEKKAIYGTAGNEFLKNAQIDVNGKLLVVANVPQSITYVTTGEVDVAIVNLTAALANSEKIGGYLEIEQKYYTPIEIVAGQTSHCKSEKCLKLLEFFTSEEAKKVLLKHGL